MAVISSLSKSFGYFLQRAYQLFITGQGVVVLWMRTVMRWMTSLFISNKFLQPQTSGRRAVCRVAGRGASRRQNEWQGMVAANSCGEFLTATPCTTFLEAANSQRIRGRSGVWATVWQWMADPEEYRSCNQRKAQPYNKLQISSLDGHGTGSALQFSGPLCRSKHVIARKNLLPELLPNATPYSYNSYVQSMPSAMKLWLPKSWLIINCQSW